jgi:hypothetical protein
MTGLQNCCGKGPLPTITDFAVRLWRTLAHAPLARTLHGSAEAVDWCAGQCRKADPL